MNTSKKRLIGDSLLDLPDSVKTQVRNLVAQYRANPPGSEAAIDLIKQAIDTPQRIRAGIDNRVADYNVKYGVGAAQTFLSECLVLCQVGMIDPVSLADIIAQLQTLQDQAQTLVAQRNAGATWDDLAAMIESQIQLDPGFDILSRIDVPPGYTTVWGEPY